MADSIIGGLFGTPEAYQTQQNQQALGRAAELAQLDPFSSARTSLIYGGNQLAGALGAQDPMLQILSQRNALAQQYDTSTSNGLAGLASALRDRNDIAGAMQVSKDALAAKQKEAELAVRGREHLSTEQKNALALADSSYERGTPEWNKEFASQLTRLTTGAEKAPPSMVAEYQFAKTPDGGSFKGSFQDFVTARAQASRPPAQPRAEQPPVPVIDPTTGKVVLVSREEALSRRMTPASAMESLSPKEIQNREAKYPQAKTAVTTFETTAERLAKDLETLANSKGLEGITGLVGGRTPGVTKDARAAEALYNSIVARGGFNELQNLRNASPTGGALGNISNQEGQQLKNAFAVIDRTQNASDMKAALLRAAQETRASAGRIKDTFDLTYEYKNQGGSAPSSPKSPATPISADDLVNKYLNK